MFEERSYRPRGIKNETFFDESGFVFPFEKIEVWYLCVDLAGFILGLLESFSSNRHIRLIGQMEAAVSGISKNIAEGKGRQYNNMFIQFLYIAIGSLFEVITLTENFKRENCSRKKRRAKFEIKLQSFIEKLLLSLKALDEEHR